MATTVTMPQLGESVTEGTIGRWLKQPGDAVAKYESIAEVISDKVNAEIPSPADGVMGEHIAAEGTVVPVGQPICAIEEQGAGGAAAESAPAAATQPAAAAAAEGVPARAAGSDGGGVVVPEDGNGTGRPAMQERPAATGGNGARAEQPVAVPAPAAAGGVSGSLGTDLHMTPAVRMLIREHGVDPAALAGSGIGGRITKKDVLEHVQQRDAGGGGQQQQWSPPPSTRAQGAPAAAPIGGATPTAASAPAAAAPQQQAGEQDTLVPHNPIRRLIAEHMVRSKATSPHAWLMVEVDMTGVVALRNRLKADYRERYHVNLTFMPIIARIVCDVLREFPNFNATWSDEGVIRRGDINLGIAVALEESLVVPVIRNADRLSVSGLAQAFDDVAKRARGNKLRVEDLQSGTFTLNNTGSLGLVATAAIINQPQAAIVTTDAIVKRAVVLPGDLIGIRSMMNLCMSLDHRINDGMQGARFLNAVKTRLEAMGADTAI